MPSLSDDLYSWSATSLQDLVDAQAEETIRIDFKERLDLVQRGGRKELAKDLSAFANSEGGYIICGVQEVDGIAAALTPFQLERGLSEKIDNLNETALAPPIPGLKHRAIRLADGTGFYVIYVPKSTLKLHQVCAFGEFRYYRRNERTCTPMSATEVESRIERRIKTQTDWLSDARSHRNEIARWDNPPEIIVSVVPVGPPAHIVLRDDVPTECPVESSVLAKWWQRRTPSSAGMMGTVGEGVPWTLGGWFVSRRGGTVLRRNIAYPFGRSHVLTVSDLVGMCRDAAALAAFILRMSGWSGDLWIAAEVRGSSNGLMATVDKMDRYDGKPYEVDSFEWDGLISIQAAKTNEWLGAMVLHLYESVGRLDCDLVNGNQLTASFMDEVVSRWGRGGWSSVGRELLQEREQSRR